MKEIPLQFPAYISKVSTMAKQLRVVVDTQDMLTDEQIAYLFQKSNKPGWFTFNVSMIENEHIGSLPPVREKEKKSPSQRLRAVIWQYWNTLNNEKEFEDFYEQQIEYFITKYKEKLC